MSKIQKIKKNYCQESGALTSIDYINSMILFSDKLDYYTSPLINGKRNVYLADKRRDNFPLNVPEYSIDLFFKKNYVNQILDYDKNYFAIIDGELKTIKAIKDKKGALIYTDDLEIDNPYKINLNENQIDEYLKNGSIDNKYDSVILSKEGLLFNEGIDLFELKRSLEMERLHKLKSIVTERVYTSKDMEYNNLKLEVLKNTPLQTDELYMVRFNKNGFIDLDQFIIELGDNPGLIISDVKKVNKNHPKIRLLK